MSTKIDLNEPKIDAKHPQSEDVPWTFIQCVMDVRCLEYLNISL